MFGTGSVVMLSLVGELIPDVGIGGVFGIAGVDVEALWCSVAVGGGSGRGGIAAVCVAATDDGSDTSCSAARGLL